MDDPVEGLGRAERRLLNRQSLTDLNSLRDPLIGEVRGREKE
jgi:hypothetical protein